MPDIAMCGDDTCPSRENCWRFIAPPSDRQSYMVFDRKGKDRCDAFMALRPHQRKADEQV